MKKNGIILSLFCRKGKRLLLTTKLTILLLAVGFMQVSAIDSYTSESKNSNVVVESTIAVDQQGVSGKITDNNGEPIPGLTVVEKGTGNGVVTNLDGEYTIVPQGEAPVLIYSFVGMITQEVIVNGQTQINITMLQDFIGIEEVVAIGYGTMKKSDLTGSVASVTPEQLVDRPVINVGQALQNKISGVQVIQQAVGEPGGRPQIRIRGTNSINSASDPLFVVDGIVGVSDALQSINPEDIASIDVLKDASATAIYGTRGANGVIIIVTKRGATGDIQVTYSGSVSLGIMTRHNYAVTADQFMYLYEQAFTNTPKYGSLNTSKDFRQGQGDTGWEDLPHLFEQVSPGAYFMDVVGNDGNYYKPRFYTDWEDEAFDPALSHNHHIDMSGGTEKAKYSFSIGSTNQEGLMLESWRNRLNTRVTMDLELNDWLDFGANIAYSRTDRARGDTQTRTVSETWPILPSHQYPDEEVYGIYAGQWATGKDFNVGENWRGINYVMDQQDGYYLDNQFTASLILNAQITNDLSFKTNFSWDNRDRTSRWARGNYQGNRTAEARAEHRLYQYWQNENYFNYVKTVGDHSITGLLGLSWSENLYDRVESRAYNFSSNFYSWNNMRAGANTPRAYSNNSRGALNSYFARATYGYLGKYMLTATGRIDGSSKFGENEKYGFFPSIGGAWRISEESFLADAEAISNLKLRLSAGQTGNQEIGSFRTQRYISNATVMMGDGLHAGLFPGSTGNPDLKWETTTQYDLGIDLGIFENRIAVVFDVYYKETNDMLFNLPLPRSTTPSNSFVNYGAVKNTGFELEVSTRNFQTTDFSWDSRLTFSSNKNEILELGPTGADVYVDEGAGNATSVYRIGEPIGSFFGLNRMGVYGTDEAVEAARYGRVPGDLKFEDVNQDGKIQLRSDGDVIGNAYPEFYGGFNNTFKYKNFDASVDFQFVGGVDKAIVHESAEDRQFVSGMVNRVMNAWRPNHQDNTMVAQVRAGNAGARYDSFTDTHEIYNAAYIRGTVASLGYTFNDLWGLNRCRVYASAENFFLWTAIELEGYDPEGSSQGKIRTNVPNIDKYQYPNPTTFSLGVNVSF